MSKFKLPPPIIDIYLEKSLYKDHPRETVFQIHPRPVDTIEKRLQRIKRYIEGIKEENKLLKTFVAGTGVPVKLQ